ncbi:MAG: thiol peroxidase [Helicobacteraceae bacterium]|nr:thiol peroxidase [Helicobacteraceae bacterium]
MAMTHFKGTDVTLGGNELNVGDKAPQISLVDANLDDITVGGENEKVQLIITVPSLDTGTCAMETTKFNNLVATLDIVHTSVISMDLPFASQKFCSTQGIDNLTVLSDYVDKDFSKAYGVLMKDNKLKGLCARAIFVVNKSGVISYKQVVNEVTDEPNYDEVLEALKDTTV